MANIHDFKKEDGSVDWDRYEKAEIAEGTRCKECNCFMLNRILSGCKMDGPRHCGGCQELHHSSEAWHDDDRVRCPVCRDVITISDTDYWESGIYEEHDTTTIECNECEYSYEVETTVTYSFKSPAMSEGA